MTIKDEIKKQAEEIRHKYTHMKIPKEKLSDCIEQALLERHNKSVEMCVELCRRKYPCGDPAHDDRYCARCRAIEDGSDMLESEILELKEK
jgi:hypothetical protein